MPQKNVPTNHSEFWKQGYNTFLKAFEQAKIDNPNATQKQNIERARASAAKTIYGIYPKPEVELNNNSQNAKGPNSFLPDILKDWNKLNDWNNKIQEIGAGVGTAARDVELLGKKNNLNQQNNKANGNKPKM